MLLAFGVVAVVLALVSAFAPRALAAEPVHTQCGRAVVWSLSPSTSTPDGAAAAIAAAYGQVAGVTGVRASQGTPEAVRWEWIEPLTGDNRTPGDQDDSTALGTRIFWAHVHGPDDHQGETGLRASVLRDILHDFGVAAPTSSATLSAADRVALRRVCADERASALAVKAGKAKAHVAGGSTPPTSGAATMPHHTGSPSVPPLARTVLLAIAGLISLGLVAIWLPLPAIRHRIAAFGGRRRSATGAEDDD
ncbi:hypothetical protein [Oryzihumus leptocrescens]|uniref:Uncharacterized protein n=1 Tax=Oryzihumus leptocrescens TaxID=297536 RepID=A0A542ZEL3_9MICO|nr:hypothetical protein [Oryzihumus leptocrescens]TQL58747.1 hypothetical protein FB474_0083 [Oryzihumus leptocrescens]